MWSVPAISLELATPIYLRIIQSVGKIAGQILSVNSSCGNGQDSSLLRKKFFKDDGDMEIGLVTLFASLQHAPQDMPSLESTRQKEERQTKKHLVQRPGGRCEDDWPYWGTAGEIGP